SWIESTREIEKAEGPGEFLRNPRAARKRSLSVPRHICLFPIGVLLLRTASSAAAILSCAIVNLRLRV
ncbi:hypothetical protein EMPG_15408, partial [Blastomyces silverae]